MIEPRAFALKVLWDGDGEGDVTSLPSGVSCASPCQGEFLEGTRVTLSAHPRPGSTFRGWSGACDASSGPCELTLDRDQSVVARFDLVPQRTLTVSKTGNGGGEVIAPEGIDCGPMCSVTVEDGTKVTLHAVPDDGSEFLGWGGACSGSSSQCSVTLVGADKSVSASFRKKLVPITVAIPTGGGKVVSQPAGLNCTSTCTASFDYGTTVTLTATPNAGWTEDDWGEGCFGQGPCKVSLVAPVNVTKAFVAASGTQVWNQFYVADDVWAGNYSGLPAVGQAIAADGTGKVYVGGIAGWYTGSSIQMSPGYAVFDASGAVQLAHDLQYSGGANVWEIRADGAGDIFVGRRSLNGSTQDSVDKFDSAATLQWTDAATRNVALAPNGEVVTAGASRLSRWSAALAPLWTTPFPATTSIQDLEVDSHGGALLLEVHNVWNGTNSLTTSTVSRYRPLDGSLEWTQALTSPMNYSVQAKALAVAPNDEIFVVATSGLLIKLDGQGHELWRDDFSRYPQGSSLQGAAPTPDGGVVVTGYVKLLVNGQIRQFVYVARYGPNGGAPIWEDATLYSNYSTGNGVVVDAQWVYVTGTGGSSSNGRSLYLAKYRL